MRRVLAVVGAMAMAGTGVVALATPAMAANCVTATISTAGASASYTECLNDNGDQVKVSGHVNDTSWDGEDARIHVSYNGSSHHDYSAWTNGSGTTVYFEFGWRDGTNAFVRLQER